MYGWMQPESAGASHRERERERERQRKRECTEGGGGWAELRWLFLQCGQIFFSCSNNPFSSTAGHRESLQFEDYMMAQLSSFSPQSHDAMLTLRYTEKGRMMHGLQSFNLPAISTLSKASNESTSTSWQRVQLSDGIKNINVPAPLPEKTCRKGLQTRTTQYLRTFCWK